mmetsp:Transcript_35402/g.84555  ORF Transcript_35402/g.84555 Transcript_35402/m.84555 type:complete len:199 (+) Transcript_35402:103-699(+)
MLMCQVCHDNRDNEPSSSVDDVLPAEIYVPLSNDDSANEYDGCYCLPTNDYPARPLSDEDDVTHQDLEALRRMVADMTVAMSAFQDGSPGHHHPETQPAAFGLLESLTSSARTTATSSRPDTPRPDYRGNGHVQRQDRVPPPPAAARPAEPLRRATDSPNHPLNFPGVRKGGSYHRSFSMPPLPFVVRRNPDGSIRRE